MMALVSGDSQLAASLISFVGRPNSDSQLLEFVAFGLMMILTSLKLFICPVSPPPPLISEIETPAAPPLHLTTALLLKNNQVSLATSHAFTSMYRLFFLDTYIYISSSNI